MGQWLVELGTGDTLERIGDGRAPPPRVAVEGPHRRRLASHRSFRVATAGEDRQIATCVLATNVSDRAQPLLMAIGEELGEIPAVGLQGVWRQVALVAHPCQEIVDRAQGPGWRFGETHHVDAIGWAAPAPVITGPRKLPWRDH